MPILVAMVPSDKARAGHHAPRKVRMRSIQSRIDNRNLDTGTTIASRPHSRRANLRQRTIQADVNLFVEPDILDALILGQFANHSTSRRCRNGRRQLEHVTGLDAVPHRMRPDMILSIPDDHRDGWSSLQTLSARCLKLGQQVRCKFILVHRVSPLFKMRPRVGRFHHTETSLRQTQSRSNTTPEPGD